MKFFWLFICSLKLSLPSKISIESNCFSVMIRQRILPLGGTNFLTLLIAAFADALPLQIRIYTLNCIIKKPSLIRLLRNFVPICLSFLVLVGKSNITSTRINLSSTIPYSIQTTTNGCPYNKAFLNRCT